MAHLFHMQLISPEKVFFSGEVSSVGLPAFDGYSTIMAHHAPLVVQLDPGFVRIDNNKDQSYFILGGFGHVEGGKLFVLADKIIPYAELSYQDLDSYVQDAREKLDHLKKKRAKGDCKAYNQQERFCQALISLRDFGLT